MGWGSGLDFAAFSYFQGLGLLNPGAPVSPGCPVPGPHCFPVGTGAATGPKQEGGVLLSKGKQLQGNWAGEGVMWPD